MAVQIEAFYDSATGTGSYIVINRASNQALIIDPVLHFDLNSGQLSFELANQQLAFLQANHLQLKYICDTHAHADHLSAAAYLKNHTDALTVISQGIGEVQQRFSARFNKPVVEDLTQLYDVLVADGDILTLGEIEIHVLATPGHTSDSVSYYIEDNIFVGDTLFMPDIGTARCDFPGADAATLYHSIARIHALPGTTKIWLCHDYPPPGREVSLQTTVAQSREHNIHINHQISKHEFIQRRQAKDRTLGVPALLYPALQVNLWGALLPAKEDNGRRFIKIPVDCKGAGCAGI